MNLLLSESHHSVDDAASEHKTASENTSKSRTQDNGDDRDSKRKKFWVILKSEITLFVRFKLTCSKQLLDSTKASLQLSTRELEHDQWTCNRMELQSPAQRSQRRLEWYPTPGTWLVQGGCSSSSRGRTRCRLKDEEQNFTHVQINIYKLTLIKREKKIMPRTKCSNNAENSAAVFEVPWSSIICLSFLIGIGFLQQP